MPDVDLRPTPGIPYVQPKPGAFITIGDTVNGRRYISLTLEKGQDGIYIVRTLLPGLKTRGQPQSLLNKQRILVNGYNVQDILRPTAEWAQQQDQKQPATVSLYHSVPRKLMLIKFAIIKTIGWQAFIFTFPFAGRPVTTAISIFPRL
jgi:hypothetical protein